MLRFKSVASTFVHRALRSKHSRFQLQCAPQTYCQPYQSSMLEKQIFNMLRPKLLSFTCHLPVKEISVVVVFTAASCIGNSFLGSGKTVKCQGEDSSIQERHIEWDEGHSPVLFWMRRLWVPMLMVMTVAMGWHYPITLGINLFFLLWSTKPTPSSIYIWVEQKRLQAVQHMNGLGRFKSQLSNALIMHVEVQDYGIACLARVSSLSQKMLVIGVLGDWWVLYSSSSSISGFTFGSWFPVSPSEHW